VNIIQQRNGTLQLSTLNKNKTFTVIDLDPRTINQEYTIPNLIPSFLKTNQWLSLTKELTLPLATLPSVLKLIK